MTTPSRILLIDDDQVDRASVRRALAKSGLTHELAEAPAGTAGLETARSQSFDCILLDYRLPDVDTFELLAQLLAPETGKHAVLMLTGENDHEVAIRLMRAGALDYITKTEATPSGLARAIGYAMARRGFLEELETARRDAEEKSLALDMLNRQKTLLLSIIAHDLRNPFQALLGFSSLLTKAVAAKDHATVERRALGLHEAAGQAYGLMESLFAWTNLQMDTLSITRSDLVLAEIAAEIIEGSAEAASDKGITLSATCGDLRVHAHREMLATILRNLVSNAVKFTMPGGSVTISARKQADGQENRIEIAVTDTGIGMPAAKVVDLFRLDKRSTTSGTAGERGSGLGLLLCHDLVERLGSQLAVESRVDKGTSFRFRLREAIGVMAPQPLLLPR